MHIRYSGWGMGARGDFSWTAAAFTALSTCAALSFTTQAHAEPAARFVYLRGKGTETCPSESDVRQAVQVRLGYDPFSTYAASTMFAEVSASSDGATFTANLKLVDADNSVRGDRSLKVQGRCADLMEAMALTISIAIDPMSVTREGPPPDAPPVERSVAPMPPIDSDAPHEPPSGAKDRIEPSHDRADADRTRPRLSASLGPLMSIGSAPGVAIGGVLSFDVQRAWLFGSVEGRVDAPASGAAEPTGRVRSSLALGALFAGIREGIFFAGGVGAVGRVQATSSDVSEAREQSALIANVGLRVGVAIPVGERLEARARAEALANLTRHTLEISGQPAYRYPIASGDVSVALAVRF